MWVTSGNCSVTRHHDDDYDDYDDCLLADMACLLVCLMKFIYRYQAQLQFTASTGRVHTYQSVDVIESLRLHQLPKVSVTWRPCSPSLKIGYGYFILDGFDPIITHITTHVITHYLTSLPASFPPVSVLLFLSSPIFPLSYHTSYIQKIHSQNTIQKYHYTQQITTRPSSSTTQTTYKYLLFPFHSSPFLSLLSLHFTSLPSPSFFHSFFPSFHLSFLSHPASICSPSCLLHPIGPWKISSHLGPRALCSSPGISKLNIVSDPPNLHNQ